MTTIEQKVAKLLALAESANEHEAGAAAARAAALIEQYNLDRANLGQRDESEVKLAILYRSQSNGVPSYIGQLSMAVGALFDLQTIQSKDNGKPCLKAVGRALNLEAAKVALSQYMLAIEQGVIRSGVRGRSEMASYRLGASFEILRRAREAQRERMEQTKAATTHAPQAWGLVVSDRTAVEQHFRQLFPHIRSGGRVSASSSSAAAAGRAHGAGVSLGNRSTIGGRLALGAGR